MRVLARTLFALYLILLAWLILFKFSFDLAAALRPRPRTLTLIPFADLARDGPREMLLNAVAFVPFGLLLSVTLKRSAIRHKLAIIAGFSPRRRGDSVRLGDRDRGHH